MDDVFKGPRFVDVVRNLLRDSAHTCISAQQRYGVGVTWYSDFCRGARTANPDTLQLIYEDLTGKALIEDAPPVKE